MLQHPVRRTADVVSSFDPGKAAGADLVDFAVQVAVGEHVDVSPGGVRPGEADHREAVDRRPMHTHLPTVGSREQAVNPLRVTVRERNGVR